MTKTSRTKPPEFNSTRKPTFTVSNRPEDAKYLLDALRRWDKELQEQETKRKQTSRKTHPV